MPKMSSMCYRCYLKTIGNKRFCTIYETIKLLQEVTLLGKKLQSWAAAER